ncbi:MAG: hypothetical protein A3H35_09130 [Betaproteobacteria bacterium RIFCSPLOWO2_02_FULL_62_17]|nr:MAG: hypothetical protein A3H35_09130 [Betaproteobacteria bacterium RIFCSPLOWO2_02_FULL_62_17]
MNRGQSVFAQLLRFVLFSHFEHLVDRFASNHGIRHFSAWNHFLCIAYSQLTRREGLRDLVAGYYPVPISFILPGARVMILSPASNPLDHRSAG